MNNIEFAQTKKMTFAQITSMVALTAAGFAAGILSIALIA
jgi:hypothetical protein